MYNNTFDQIDNIVRKNLEQRGMDQVRLPGELEKTAKELIKSSTVFIVTGFCIRDTLTGETDGPLGAISLASALEQLGKNVILVTDQYSKDMLYVCSSVKKVKAPIEVVPSINAETFCINLIRNYKPSHVVAVERPGRAIDGCCYSMRGENISDIVPNTDVLFEKSKELGIVTVAVGDGGNEIGMGKVAQLVVKSVKHGEKICAAFSADYLIIAGVSNWGGHAITAALSIVKNTMLLHDILTEQYLLEKIVEAGAVDGCTRKSVLTVDGLSLNQNLEILQKLRRIVESVINKNRELEVAM